MEEEIKMFSNGTEYEIFLEEHCYKCKHFKNWEIEEPCPIEEKMHLARFDENEWPKEKIVKEENSCWFTCKDFEVMNKEEI